MALYRIEFIKDWITGRWGFTDRVFHDMKGKETEPSRLENAWMLEYGGRPDALGKLLSKKLNIQPEDFKRYGPIFEITILRESDPVRVPGSNKAQAPRRQLGQK